MNLVLQRDTLIPVMLVFAIIGGCAARSYPSVKAGRKEIAERMKIQSTIRLMQPNPRERWIITVLPDKVWWRRLRHLYGGNIDRSTGGSAYTLTKSGHTFINAEWIRSHRQEEIAVCLAHEWGHIVCKGCDDDEAMADRAGSSILLQPVTIRP